MAGAHFGTAVDLATNENDLNPVEGPARVAERVAARETERAAERRAFMVRLLGKLTGIFCFLEERNKPWNVGNRSKF